MIRYLSLLLGCLLASSLASHAAPASWLITLEQADDLVIATDQSIQSALWEIRKARLEPLSALTRLGPTILGSAGGSAGSQSTSGLTTQMVRDDAVLAPASTRSSTVRSQAGSLGLSYQQTLLDLSVIPAFKRGKLTAAVARLSYRATIREVLFGLAEAYYEVLKQQRILQVSQETLHLGEEQLRLAQTRAAVGEVTRSDVLRAEVTVASARQSTIEAENTLLSKRNVLANILNLSAERNFAVAEPVAVASSIAKLECAVSLALSRREDLQVKELAVEQDVQRRQEVRAEYAPKVVASLSADRNQVSGSSAYRDHSWDAAVTVQVPFFTGGQREIDLAQAGYQINQSRLALQTFQKQVQEEVTDAWLRVRTLEETLKTVRTRVSSAQQAYGDLRTQYQAGTATSVDVLSALNDLNTAQRDLATQTYDLQVAHRSLAQKTGTYQQARLNKLKFK